MTKCAFFSSVVASAFCLTGMANAAVVDGSSFTATAEILGTREVPIVGTLVPLSVSVSQSGTVTDGANTPADAELVFAGVEIGSLLDVNLGVLGVDWLTDDTFELIFDLDATLSTFLGTISVPLGFDGTIDWDITDIVLTSGQVISGVTQIAGSPDLGYATSFTDNSVSIVSNTLVGLDTIVARQTYQLTFEDNPPVSAVPLPAAMPLLFGGIALMGGLRLRRKKA